MKKVAPEPDAERAVVDTSVILSAMMFPRSVPAQALRLARSRFTLLASQATIDELTDVVSREKFDRYLALHERKAIIRELLLESQLIEVSKYVNACRDPRDNKFLSLAVTGKARWIVTGDADLLVLHPFRGIEILTPAAFLAR